MECWRPFLSYYDSDSSVDKASDLEFSLALANILYFQIFFGGGQLEILSESAHGKSRPTTSYRLISEVFPNSTFS